MHNKKCLGITRGYCGYHRSDCCGWQGFTPPQTATAAQKKPKKKNEGTPVKDRAALIRRTILDFLQRHGGDVHGGELKTIIAAQLNIHPHTVYYHLRNLLKTEQVVRVERGVFRAVDSIFKY